MATYQVPAPAQMSLKGDMVENFKTFKSQWEFYLLATELDKKMLNEDGTVNDAGKTQVAATLCSVIGPGCLKILNSIAGVTAADKRDPNVILQKLEAHFIPQRHVLFERFKFFSATQAENETIDNLGVRLRQLSESCEFENLRDSLIRDRLVMGTSDTAARDRLLRERPVPNLNRCLEVLRASELSKTHKEQMRSTLDNSSHEVHGTQRFKKPQRSKPDYKQKKFTEKKASTSHQEQHDDSVNPKKCKFCGMNHKRRNCPAYGKTCLKCGGSNHFANCCYQKEAKGRKLHHLSQGCKEDSSNSDSDIIFVINRTSERKYSKFMIPLKFHTQYSPTVEVQLDTGATCSAMSIDQLRYILQTGDVQLNPTVGKIKLYDGTIISPLGSYTLSVSRGGEDPIDITFDIMENAPWPIIDGSTCIRNNWISMENVVHAVQSASREPLTKEKVLQQYADVFKGLGCLPGDYHIEIDTSVKPVQHAPRRVPVPLKEKLKAKIDELEKQGIITKVTEHTDWISSLVAVQKSDKLRICIDPKDLNFAIKRSNYQMPTVDEILPRLKNAKVFTVLDAKDGFFQIKLDKDSSYLTTFWTPFGRYRYLRCPQGISSAPEEYQRRQKEVLSGLNGVDVIADDIICFGSGSTVEEANIDHDLNLIALLNRIREVNLKLNCKKLRFKLSEVPYMGHLLTESGVKPDPSKIEAILQMPKPSNVKAIQRLLGCVQYLARYLPKLSEVSEPLRRLTVKDVPWHWESQQEESYHRILQLIVKAPVLRYYDIGLDVTIECDSSETGLGACLLQDGQPVAFASRALSNAEKNYAQIEKECLAIVFSCERFDQYLHGRKLITVHTDHKPLVSIMLKSIHQAPKRLQRMMMRLQKYNLKLVHISGVKMFISDMLSRAYLPQVPQQESVPRYHIFQLMKENSLFKDIESINQVDHMSLSDSTHHQIKSATMADQVLQTLATTVITGWPETKESVPINIREYWNFRDVLTVQDGIVYKGMKVVVPKSLRGQMVAKAHTSHLGQEACVRRARDVIFWPGMSGDIKDKVSQCSICAEFSNKQSKEPLMTHEIPSYPWSKVGQDLFSLYGESYLVTVDYYSDYFELDHLQDTSSNAVIEATKIHFARHGIADMVTDNGPQYTSQEFDKFSKDWEFTHITSSPLHSQSNGKAESAVKIAKQILKKVKRDNGDLQMAILEWRNTPDINGFSPAQKLMSRRTKTTMPAANTLLQPSVVQNVPEMVKTKRQKAKLYYDRHSKLLPELEIGESVRLQPFKPKQPWSSGSCIGKVGPRSYLIETDNNIYRRNRKFIRRSSEMQRHTDKESTLPVLTTETQLVDNMLESTTPNNSNSRDHQLVDSNGLVLPTNSDFNLLPKSPTVITRSGRKSVKPSRYGFEI